METAKKALGWLTRLECVIAAIGLTSVALILLADVLGRQFLGHGIYWGPRLASYLTTVTGMLGFSIVVASGDHLRPELVDGIFPKTWDSTMNRVADLLSAALCAFIAFHAAWFVYTTYEIGTRAIALNIPVWPIQTIVPYVFASASLRYLAYACIPEIRPVDRGELG